MFNILTDTCYWIGLIDPQDQHHTQSLKIRDELENFNIIFPFPCFYEIIRTKFVKDKRKLQALEDFMGGSGVTYLFDDDYIEAALEKVYELNKMSYITHSLADAVIREMLSDVGVKLDYLVTFNVKDFADICAQRNIGIIDK